MKYRKKPVIIEAMQFLPEKDFDLLHWVHDGLPPEANSVIVPGLTGISVRTLEGWVTAAPGDYIIRGVRGEYYPCQKDIFEETYEVVP